VDRRARKSGTPTLALLERKAMPKVGKKHFSYTKAGYAAAAAEAKKTGKKVTKKKPTNKGNK
jgi:hypothetical protein